MEMLAFRNCMDSLLACGLVVQTLITDRHLSISKYMRENLVQIKHYYDLWHLKKSMILSFHYCDTVSRGVGGIGYPICPFGLG